MRLDALVEGVVAAVNEGRSGDRRVLVEAVREKAFTLSFLDEPVPEGSCLDQLFTEVQFRLHDAAQVDTAIIGGRFEEERGRYFVEYELVEWD